MRGLQAWLFTVVILQFLSGCDRLTSWKNDSLDSASKKEGEGIIRRPDAILANQDNYKIDIDVSCLVEFFPYGEMAETPGIEKVKIRRSRSEEASDGWGPVVMSEVKVTGWGKDFEGSLISSSQTYATIGFGGQINDGATTSLFVATYMIDLINLKFKRTVSLFPFGEESVSQGVCRKTPKS